MNDKCSMNQKKKEMNLIVKEKKEEKYGRRRSVCCSKKFIYCSTAKISTKIKLTENLCLFFQFRQNKIFANVSMFPVLRINFSKFVYFKWKHQNKQLTKMWFTFCCAHVSSSTSSKLLQNIHLSRYKTFKTYNYIHLLLRIFH